MRQKIGMEHGVQEAIVTMSEGNPGALSVLMKLMGRGMEGFVDILHLDDMNIRGTQIWVAWKDWAKQDLDVFVEAIRARNPEMVAKVNEARISGNHSELAVTSGASFA